MNGESNNNYPKNQINDEKKLKKTNPRKGLQLFFAFIGGMLFATLLLGVLLYMYGIGKFNASLETQTPNNLNTNSNSSNSSKTEGKESVSEEELSQYVSAKDCTTIDEYSSLEISIPRTTMKSIDLEQSRIIVGNKSLTQYPRWKNDLPKVVDKDCNTLKLTQIKAGDTLNLYSSPSDADGIPSNLQLIQRIN